MHIIEKFDYQEICHPSFNQSPEGIINSNTFQLIRLTNNQFTSILYLLWEDIILIFRRCKEANTPASFEIDFPCISFLDVIFTFKRRQLQNKFIINISHLQFIPNTFLKIITLFNHTNLITTFPIQEQSRSDISFEFLIPSKFSKFSFIKNNLFHIKLISLLLHMLTTLIVKIHWPSAIALSPIVANHLNCFQNPLREYMKPIFRRQIETFIFFNLEFHFYEPYHIISKFLSKFKHDLLYMTKNAIPKTDFDHFISLSKPFIGYPELTLNFLKITNKSLQTFNQNEIRKHIKLKNQVIFISNFISHLFSNTRKTLSTHNLKICNSYFFLYQFKICKLIPSFSLQAEWGTFKKSFFLRYVTNDIQ
jgi:hypothetical protein